MSDTCSLFPPFGDPSPSYLLPSHKSPGGHRKPLDEAAPGKPAAMWSRTESMEFFYFHFPKQWRKEASLDDCILQVSLHLGKGVCQVAKKGQEGHSCQGEHLDLRSWISGREGRQYSILVELKLKSPKLLRGWIGQPKKNLKRLLRVKKAEDKRGLFLHVFKILRKKFRTDSGCFSLSSYTYL